MSQETDKLVTESGISPGDNRGDTLDVRSIRIGEIIPGSNIRLSHTASNQEHLKASIAIAGILSPLMVREAAGRFEIINGFGRYRAAKDLGLESLPCMVLQGEWDDSKRLQCQFHENVFRSDLDPISIAQAMRAAKKTLRLTQTEMARVFGTSQSRFSEYTNLLKLPKEQQQQLREGTLGIKKALEIRRASKRPAASGDRPKPKPPIQINDRQVDLSKALVVPVDESLVIIAGDGSSAVTSEFALKVLRKLIKSMSKQRRKSTKKDTEVNEALNEFAKDVFEQ